MTDNEIKKAWELCFAEKGTKQTCGECPYHKFGELCKVKRGRDTLDLINRQQEEIQQITEKFNCQQTVYADLSKIIKDQKAEIERLKAENLFLSQKRANIFEIINANEKGRIRGIKEFENLLINNLIHETYSRDFLIALIRQYAKEMVGES